MTPEEQAIHDLYHQEVCAPDYSGDYMDISKLPEGGGIQARGGGPCGVDHGIAAQVHRTPVIAPKCNTNLHKLLGPNGKINHLPNMFLAMAQDAAAKELPSATLAIGMYGDDTSGILPGQYVAELHLVIHRMPDDKEVAENVPVPREQ
jgi:hypothetical protein